MNSQGIISAPVGVAEDISIVLGVPSTDLGTLCSDRYKKINKFSKKKPVCMEGVDVNLTYTIPGYEWWRAYNGQCGISIPTLKMTSTAAAVEKFFDGSMRWTYEAPPPSVKFPARALDFDGYYHYATPFFSSENLPKDIWLIAGYGEHYMQLSLDVMTTGTEHNLGLSDLKIQHDGTLGESENLSDWYPGVLMKKGDYWFVQTSKTVVGDYSFDIKVSGDQDTLAGTWQVVPILSSKPVNTYAGEDVEALYILVDYTKSESEEFKPIEIRVHKLGTLVYGLANAYWASGEDIPNYRYVDYYAYIHNNSTSDYMFKEVKIFIGYTEDGKHPYDSITGLINTKTFSINDIYVPAKESEAENPVIIEFKTESEGGDWPRLDIGPIYVKDPELPEESYKPNAIYWVGIQLCATDTCEVVPYEAYMPLEEYQPE